jgi:RNA polymerase subunit RPABC4/transcription elongation factor Spt4
MSILRRLLGGHHGGGHGRSDHHGGHHGRGGYGYDYGYGSQSPGPGSASQTAPQSIACMRCGAGNNAAGRFCQQCGFSLRPMACGKCAEPLGAENKFCPNCGTQVPASSG